MKRNMYQRDCRTSLQKKIIFIKNEVHFAGIYLLRGKCTIFALSISATAINFLSEGKTLKALIVSSNSCHELWILLLNLLANTHVYGKK